MLWIAVLMFVCLDSSAQVHSGDRNEHGARPSQAVPTPSIPHILHQ